MKGEIHDQCWRLLIGSIHASERPHNSIRRGSSFILIASLSNQIKIQIKKQKTQENSRSKTHTLILVELEEIAQFSGVVDMQSSSSKGERPAIRSVELEFSESS